MRDQSGAVISGASRCEACRERTRVFGHYQGKDYGIDTCYENREVRGPAGCVSPSPPIEPANASLWEAFLRAAHGGGLAYRGMDGIPMGVRQEAFEACARAYGLEWNSETLGRLQLLERYWKADVDQRIEEQRQKSEMEQRK